MDEEIPKLKNLYSLAYVYNSIADFMYFRNILQQLPESYFLKLKHIYIVDANFVVKVVEKFSFGVLNDFILRRVIHIEK